MWYLRFPSTVLLLTATLLWASPLQAQEALAVRAIWPPAQAANTAADAPIIISFNRSLNTTAVTTDNLQVMGRWSGVKTGSFFFSDRNARLHFQPDEPFAAGEKVTVTVPTGLLAANGEKLGTGYSWQFWIQTSPGTLDLQLQGTATTRLPGETFIQSYGAYAGDLDEDGFGDLVVPNERTNDIRVFINDGLGNYDTFTVYDIPGGSRPSTNEGADFDGDGDIDFAVGNSSGNLVSVFEADGRGGFTGVQGYTVAQGVRGLTVLDFDYDGDPDIATASRDDGDVSLLENLGDGTFGPATLIDPGGIGESAIEAADMNGDGLLDLVVGARTSTDLFVLLGDGQGGFTVGPSYPAGGQSWMIATGDVNGDGFVDVASANSTDNNVGILLGDGLGGLLPAVTYPTGAFSLAVDLGDLDGDGDLDVVTSDYSGRSWTVYENLGDGLLGTPRTLAAASAGSCAILHDRDGDGDLDITGVDELDDQLFLFTNPGRTPHRRHHLEADVAPSGAPNPFTTSTTLYYTLPEAGAVRMEVYDLLGRRVRTLVNRRQQPGEHRALWDGTDAAGLPVAAGVYLWRMTYEDGQFSGTMLLTGPR